MPTRLQLDLQDAPLIELREDCVIPAGAPAANGQANGQGGGDARAVVAGAMASPLGFPPLAEAVVPGDRVAIALGAGIPDLPAVAGGLVDAIESAGVEPTHITLVAADPADAELLRASRQTLPAGAMVVLHDPKDEKELCYAGVTREDDASLLVNRALFDADLAIPVSCARSPDDCENRGAYDGLYPAFSDADSQKQYRRSAELKPRWWRKRTDEAGWTIGAPFVVRVIPGAHGTVAGAVAGAAEEVAAAADDAARRAWRRDADPGADLVIATVTGDPDRQSWDDIARALAAAGRLTAPGGAVALCTGLNQPIGRSLSRLIDQSDLDPVARKLEKDGFADTRAARQIVRALERGPVFFMSRLEAGLVEDLGMAPIANGTELQRLADRFGVVALLEDAQHVAVATGAEA